MTAAHDGHSHFELERPLRLSSAGTLYYQLYLRLCEMIRSGEVRPGERLPTEAKLVERYAVSRPTARRALDELRRQGLVVRHPGRGTFLLLPRLASPVPHLQSITEEIKQLGYTPGVVPISSGTEPAPDHVAEHFGIAPGEPILVVKRVRTADGRPVYVSDSRLNVVAFPQLNRIDMRTPSLQQALEDLTGLQVVRTTQWLSAEAAPREIAEMLEINTGAPVLKLDRVVYLEGDHPVDCVEGYFHGGVYKHYSEARPRYPARDDVNDAKTGDFSGPDVG